jgi:CheY-like chemotaxis protein
LKHELCGEKAEMITGERKRRDKRCALDIGYSQDNLMIPSLRALLVDDGSPILTVLRCYLKDFGYSVTTASGGQSALFELTNEDFDIFITDLLTPDLDGSFLLKTGKGFNPEMKAIRLQNNYETIPAAPSFSEFELGLDRGIP